MIGLPIQQYKSTKDEFQKYIEDNRGKTVICKGIKEKLLYTDILIAPEGASNLLQLNTAKI